MCRASNLLAIESFCSQASSLRYNNIRKLDVGQATCLPQDLFFRKLDVGQATCLTQDLFFRKLVACATTLLQASSLRYNDKKEGEYINVKI